MNRKTEEVFEVLGEGGGLFISRIIQNGVARFTGSHHENDFSDEGLDFNKEMGYASFEEAFQYINKFPWHLLHIQIIHKDYKDFILNRLVEKLGEDEYVPDNYLNRSLSRIEELLAVSIYKNQSGQWCFSLNDISAATKWDKSNISFENYRGYIQTKRNRFDLTLIDLLYISNFKGGNATINEPEDEINYKLAEYSNELSIIGKEFYGRSLIELNSQDIKRLAERILGICILTDKYLETNIDGFSVSYLSALLSAYFPDLIPILDRRVLINLQLVTEQDINSQGQIKNIIRFYPQLIEKIASLCKELRLSVREIDRKLFVTNIKTHVR